MKAPSIEDLEDWTWREFQLRLMGYRRQFKESWLQTRCIAYQMYLTMPIKGKHVSINKFMPLDEVNSNMTDSMHASLREARRIAIEQSKQQNNG